MLFNALAFQDRLAVVDENVATVNEALIDGLDGLSDAWSRIMDEVAYVPVFELAGFIADVLKDAPDEFHLPVIEPLVQAVRETWTLEGHDLPGQLFHRLLSDAKITGAYCSSEPAATMLSRLVVHNWPAGVDWSDHEFPASLNVADLACGTGTRLMADYPTRAALDDGMSEIFGSADLRGLRVLLASEPVVCNRWLLRV